MSTKPLLTETESHGYKAAKKSMRGGNVNTLTPESISNDVNTLIAQLQKMNKDTDTLAKISQSKLDLLKVGNSDFAKMNMP
jgi:hypothetical protein